ncbi:MAG: hypothetical protein ABI852_06550 [Gemmatimonadaceae bacterium]
MSLIWKMILVENVNQGNTMNRKHASRLSSFLRSSYVLPLVGAATFFVVTAVFPDTALAMAPLAEEGGWATLCAGCVGFALGAGIFALPELILFLLTPAGEMALAGCGVACAEAIGLQ